MSGLKIGIGVGLSYPTPIGKIKGVVPQPPEEDIKDALLMEDGTLFLMENEDYFKLEIEEV